MKRPTRRTSKRALSPWQRWEVQAYVLESYAGAEWSSGEDGVSRPSRQFLWADDNREVWLGNASAFALHLAERFGYEAFDYDYVNINKILIDAGERLIEPRKRSATGARPNQQPIPPRKERAR